MVLRRRARHPLDAPTQAAMLTSGDFDTDREFMEYCAARAVWAKRDELTPIAKVSWSTWFKQKFGRALDEARREFMERMDP